LFYLRKTHRLAGSSSKVISIKQQEGGGSVASKRERNPFGGSLIKSRTATKPRGEMQREQPPDQKKKIRAKGKDRVALCCQRGGGVEERWGENKGVKVDGIRA